MPCGFCGHDQAVHARLGDGRSALWPCGACSCDDWAEPGSVIEVAVRSAGGAAVIVAALAAITPN